MKELTFWKKNMGVKPDDMKTLLQSSSDWNKPSPIK